MSTPYTPGPWDESNGKIFGSTATAIATVHKHQSPTVTLANARLIAAAPDLLEALQALMCDHGGSRAVSSDDDRAIKARAAIAKATGATT